MSAIAPDVRHVFVTQDYGPDLGGIARVHVELCRRLAHAGGVLVSTVSHANASEFDAGEPYRIAREPFDIAAAKRAANQVRWAQSLPKTGILHCGNIRPAGYPVWYMRRPYVVYVYGLDLLKERRKIAVNPVKRWTLRRILGDARGIVAISQWSADLTREVMREAGIKRPPPVAAIDLGTDPDFFRPGVVEKNALLTVARLVPHKGQDVVIRALARLPATVRYTVVGAGPDRPRLEAIAQAEGVAQRVAFTGALSDDAIAKAYASADVYVGLSREEGVQAEGFGISFIEAAASGVPSVAGRSGGVASAVRDGETGVLVSPTDPAAAAAAIRRLLDDRALRDKMGHAARAAVESHYNWDRVARETIAFVEKVCA
ncbi:MAG TPA: glycosyltransferase family 4 protein [Gemmatimonadaceae bacterium]|nr:glycosyltransferase family 4 protein [Gemmatimonadaceae bacterium]